jgi:hypothetical protein
MAKMLTEEQILNIRKRFQEAEGEKAEVFDVMYANFTDLLDTASASPKLLEACKVAEEFIKDANKLLLAHIVPHDVAEDDSALRTVKHAIAEAEESK